MGVWCLIFIFDLLVPCILILFGRVFLKKPPQNINSTYGYRTTMSMKNMDTWKFAHAYCGKLWWRAGWITLCISVIVMLSVLSKDIQTVSVVGGVLCGIQCILLIATIFPIERALKQKFDRFGRKKY